MKILIQNVYLRKFWKASGMYLSKTRNDNDNKNNTDWTEIVNKTVTPKQSHPRIVFL